MAFIINEECINCGVCVDSCPVQCISEGDERFVIDKAECIDCGACADVCPVGAPNPA